GQGGGGGPARGGRGGEPVSGGRCRPQEVAGAHVMGELERSGRQVLAGVVARPGRQVGHGRGNIGDGPVPEARAAGRVGVVHGDGRRYVPLRPRVRTARPSPGGGQWLTPTAPRCWRRPGCASSSASSSPPARSPPSPHRAAPSPSSGSRARAAPRSRG